MGRGCLGVRRRYKRRNDWHRTCKAAVDGTAWRGATAKIVWRRGKSGTIRNMNKGVTEEGVQQV